MLTVMARLWWWVAHGWQRLSLKNPFELLNWDLHFGRKGRHRIFTLTQQHFSRLRFPKQGSWRSQVIESRFLTDHRSPTPLSLSDRESSLGLLIGPKSEQITKKTRANIYKKIGNWKSILKRIGNDTSSKIQKKNQTQVKSSNFANGWIQAQWTQSPNYNSRKEPLLHNPDWSNRWQVCLSPLLLTHFRSSLSWNRSPAETDNATNKYHGIFSR